MAYIVELSKLWFRYGFTHLITLVYGSEYQYFLLYYLVRCMGNILEMKYFDHYLGERHATLNLHYLLHSPQSVKELGPLWANTCYEFENSNSVLKKLLHGTHKVDMQIPKRIGFVHFVHSKMSTVNDKVLYQCCCLKARQNKCNVIVDHDGKLITVLPTEVKQLFKTGVGNITLREYRRSSKRCDYAVFVLQDNQYYCGFIEIFLVLGKV
uniref:Uncharacterized protein n=1 Tax=Amphimedon queenslandica TaxID=400682 RepID=A0A1X7UUT9_AMPQE